MIRRWWNWLRGGSTKAPSFQEAYRRLAMQLHFNLGDRKGGCCLMMTSPADFEITARASL
ncbi:MAG: hypothetical protein HY706_04335, partial [Candidatus Hydrogenedentes bacterium]|nr:hypothetical protein [Candidatus Hydrogenedentota bacterium]